MAIILMRAGLAEEDELETAKRFFTVIENRSDIQKIQSGPKTLVIPRYAALPYYKELEYDVDKLGGQLINSYRQHNYVADIHQWYWDFEDVTPKTWFHADMDDVYLNKLAGSFVLKGHTNSRKHRWKDAMFAATSVDIPRVMCNLLDDPLISEQGVCIRQFEKFASAGVGLNGLPITDEWRYFILDGQVIGAGFYWSEHVDNEAVREKFIVPPEWPERVRARTAFVEDLLVPRLKDKIRFVVADVARLEDTNTWRLVELNDGQMSGLSALSAGLLYYSMSEVLTKKE